MNFVFSLQKLLDLREQEAKKALLDWEIARNKVHEVKTLLLQERDLYFEDRTGFNSKVTICAFGEAKLFEESLALRQKKMLALLQSLRDLQRDCDEKERLTKSLQKAQKILEKLKEKRHKEYQKRISRKEAQLMDDVARSRRFAQERESQ